MLFHKSFTLSLESLKYLINKDSQDYITVAEISKANKVSRTFLSKVLQKLVTTGFLESKTGPHSGYRLAPGAEKISLMQIVRVFNDEAVLHDCVLGISGCSAENPCILYSDYEKFRNQISATLLQMTVGDLKGSVKL